MSGNGALASFRLEEAEIVETILLRNTLNGETLEVTGILKRCAKANILITKN